MAGTGAFAFSGDGGPAASAAIITGCGANNGFGIPTTTSMITITATSGTTVHSTQVTLTIQ